MMCILACISIYVFDYDTLMTNLWICGLYISSVHLVFVDWWT